MFKKILAIVLYFLALSGLVFIFIVLVLKAVFPEHKLKQLFSDGICGYTSRQAKFKSIKWGLNGIDIEGASISAKPDFNKGTFLTAIKINYKPEFLPGKTAGLLTIDSPTVLVEYIPGSFDIRLSSAAEQIFGNTGNRPRYIPLIGLKIINGEIEFLNKKTGRKDVVVNKIELSLKKAQSLGKYEGGLSSDISCGGQNIGIKADVSIDYKTATVSLSNAKIQAGQAGALVVSGSIKDISSAENIGYDFNVKGDRRALDKLFELLPGGLGSLQYGTKDKVDMNITSGAGNLKVKDNLYGR